MSNRITCIIPLFIKLRGTNEKDVWVNINRVSEMLVFGDKTVVVYTGKDVRDIKESPEEIIEKLVELQ